MKKIMEVLELMTKKARAERKLKEYTEKVSRYMAMSDDELDMTYIDIQVKHEYLTKKLTLIAAALILTAIADIWKYMFDLLTKIFEYSFAFDLEEKQATQITFLVVLFIGITILTLLITYVARLFSSINKISEEEKIIERIVHRKRI